jgi:glutamate N-acetyltransferase/amino-acid N-acetyltransferase
LRRLLAREVDATLNCVTVDGDTSTNDSCFLLASGAAQNPVVREDDRAGKALASMLGEVLQELAIGLVRDGEGAKHVVAIEVSGAESPRAARQVARRIALSPLVKTAIAGADPNWGRVFAAIGNAGVPIDPERIDLAFDDVPLVKKGQPVGDLARAQKVMQKPSYAIRVQLHHGRAQATYWTCDLTAEYVAINADYRT